MGIKNDAQNLSHPLIPNTFLGHCRLTCQSHRILVFERCSLIKRSGNRSTKILTHDSALRIRSCNTLTQDLRLRSAIPFVRIFVDSL